MRGTIDLPLNSDTIAILNYNRVGEYIYIHTSTIIGDKTYPGPQKIKDFHVVYSDSSSCTVQWTAPYANNIYDRGTEYDMRYANDLVDADDPKVWAGLRKVPGRIPDARESRDAAEKRRYLGLVPEQGVLRIPENHQGEFRGGIHLRGLGSRVLPHGRQRGHQQGPTVST